MNIINFNTSYATLNLGDFIIVDAIHKEMDYLFKNNFVYELPTHTPVAPFYQLSSKDVRVRMIDSAKYKFIDGTNILKESLLHLRPSWNINILNCRPYKGSVLIGAGMSGVFRKPDLYTRLIYKKILSKKYIHSARDEKTKRMLESMGYKAINTGCPTLWMLTNDFCKQIPTNKSRNVVFTLTDYREDKKNDEQMINILRQQYERVYFWIQGSRDLDYFNSLSNTGGIELVPPNLSSFEELLARGDIDYVGTRLHAGIFAMRHKIRSLIIIVDNRARDMKETYNLNVLERNDISQLESIINGKMKTDIKIDQKRINKWKLQFKNE